MKYRVRYSDEEPPDEEYSDAIYELEDEVGECSRCGRREALVLTVGLERYCGECSEKITEDW